MRPTLLIRDIPVAEEQPSELVEVTPDALNMLDQSGNDAANAFSAALGDGANGANGANGSEPKPDAFAELLHPHPDPALLEENDVGMLPRISDDGRRPWRVYSRPYNELDTRPRVAVVLTDLGLDSMLATEFQVRLESSSGLRLPESLVIDHPTVEAVVGHLWDRLNGGESSATN